MWAKSLDTSISLWILHWQRYFTTSLLSTPGVLILRKQNITKLIFTLEASGFITDYKGYWRSLLLFAANPRQESCTDIHTFILRLYVSYRTLNAITFGFEFLIPRYADSIEDLGDSCDSLSIIFLITWGGYHQIRGQESDQKKLSPTTSGTKKTYKVLPFVPTHALAIYSVMMQSLRKSSCFCLLIRIISSASNLLLFQLYLMTRLSFI